MKFSSVRIRGFLKAFALGLTSLFCLITLAVAAAPGQRYTGRVLYYSNKAPVAGVLVEVVEAEGDGEPTDEVLGSAHADAEGHFAVTLAVPTDRPVTLTVSAVRTFADSGGDRRSEGYDVKTHRTLLGYLPHPSAAKSNTIFVHRRIPGHPVED